MLIEDDILLKIVATQVGENNAYFPVGSFPCYRENRSLKYRRPDDNVFGTASTAFILNELRSLLSENNKRLVDEISKRAIEIYPLYRNKDGLPTYNFWRTVPSQHFPNGRILKRLKHFKLPDDIDDTALIYLTEKHSDEETFWLKEKLTQHTNLKNKPKNYVYNTWFGKTMPIEQDVCALCNLMYWIFKNDLSLNGYDEATLRFLKEKITSGDFLKFPFQAARHYATIPLILYHYARLIGTFDISQLVECKSIIVGVAEKMLLQKNGKMDKILLSTVLLKLKPQSKILKEFPVNTNLEDTLFYSFVGAFFAPYLGIEQGNKSNDRDSLIQKIARHPMGRFNWKCEAHEMALRLENVVLRKHHLSERFV